jgi:hypothetical protein
MVPYQLITEVYYPSIDASHWKNTDNWGNGHLDVRSKSSMLG